MKVIGYVLDQENEKYKDKYYFEYSVRSLFQFINDHTGYDIYITTIEDRMILSFDNGMIYGIGFEDEYIFDVFLPALNYFQEFGVEGTLEFEQIEPGVMVEKK